MVTAIFRSAALLACVLAAAAPQAADQPPLPVEQFFGNPAMTGASISPDGRFVAMRERSPLGRTMLTVINTETREQKVVANYSNADVSMFYWLSDERLVFTTINVDHDGEMGKPGLYAVNRNGENFRTLSEVISRKRSFADSIGVTNAYMSEVAMTGFPYRKKESTFAIQRTTKDLLVRLSTRNGAVTEIRAPGGTFRWLVDPEGEVRVAMARRGDDEVVFYHDDENDWRQLATFKAQSEAGFTPLIYAAGTLYVRAYKGNNEAAIYRYDLKQNALAPQATIEVPGYDADGYFLVGETTIRGYRINSSEENTVWFDPTMKAIQAEVDALLPANVNTIAYGSHSATPQVLIDTYSDLQDHIYLLYNRDSKKMLRLGAATELDPHRMAPMNMVRYPARDGLQIPLFVTHPGAAQDQPRPTLVLMGRSATHRSYWAWDEEVQFLASRGYVVLQPQPRGVGGFGLAHIRAGQKQAGRAVQDDIADAVAWSVAQGYTDPARVCILGSGDGGYAAMMGLIRNGSVFKCGVSWSGVTDNAEAEISPLQNTARITQPVLLAYGKEDERVPFKDGRKFYTTLAATNPKVEWLEYTPGVEDWKTQGNRIDLWRRIEAFLNQHIGRAAPGP
jgi:dipeptidyl aminopeptidase/acylaminoacyl peptidase